MASTSSFYEDELRASLQEQVAYIDCFEALDHNGHEATARVHVPEGKTVDIILTARGFQVSTMHMPRSYCSRHNATIGI